MTPEAESMCRQLADDAFSEARIRQAMEWAYRDAAERVKQWPEAFNAIKEGL